MILSHSRVSAGQVSQAFSRLSSGFQVVSPIKEDQTVDVSKVEVIRKKQFKIDFLEQYQKH